MRTHLDSAKTWSPKQRSITPLLRDAAPLLMVGSALAYTNRWLTLTNDEASAITAAAQNLTTILATARSTVENTHPLLYQLLLHVWLRISGGAFDWLRAPAIVCFLLGLWLLSRAVRKLGGEESGNALVWLGALWPFGFHAGRLAGPYSFGFLLTAAATWQYFRCIRSRTNSDVAIFCALSLMLLYTNDFGWALIILLGIDYLWSTSERNGQENEPPKSDEKIKAILATGAVLAIGFAPRWPVLLREIHSHFVPPASARFLFLDAAYNFYVLFVSQSVAPWFWRLSVPAAIGVIVLFVFVFAGIRGTARRLLLFALSLFVLMALSGIAQTDQLLLLGPWFLMPMAIALGTVEKWQWRIPMAVALAAVAAIGWYGALNRRYYADSRFFEPWSTVSEDAANALRSGSGIISNDNAFFLYLTYALKAPEPSSSWRFMGSLPRQVQYASVWDAQQWEQAGEPKPPSVLWVRGSSPPEELAEMNRVGEKLGQACGDRITRYLTRDPAFMWKQRFVPNFSGLAWRIEIRQYLCGETATPPSSGGTPPAGSH
jgi:MFS family permease